MHRILSDGHASLIDCDINKYLKECECMRTLVDNLVITCDQTEDSLKSAVINPSYRINYPLIIIVLAIISNSDLLFMLAIVESITLQKD